MIKNNDAQCDKLYQEQSAIRMRLKELYSERGLIEQKYAEAKNEMQSAEVITHSTKECIDAAMFQIKDRDQVIRKYQQVL